MNNLHLEHRPKLEKPFKYHGSKYGHGSYQRIINEIPPFKNLVIGFLGACPIARYFTRLNYKITAYDLNEPVVRAFNEEMGCTMAFWVSFFESSVFKYPTAAKDTFVYMDPPYLKTDRRSDRDIYDHEMTEADHIKLLVWAQQFSGNIAISHYDSCLYNEYLPEWRKVSCKVQTRQGEATEVLYCNYAVPNQLASYEFLGDGFTDRQRIRRKLSRLYAKIANLPTLEREAILSMLQNSAF